jgi:pantoate--beta-alanine ligase
VEELRSVAAQWRRAGERIALVPTMGGLHPGHLALVAAAREQAGRVVASVFVNPTQFGAGEDFDRYPRDLERDASLLTDAGCDLLFAPPVEAVYPDGFRTTVHVAGLGARWCGAARPGHFDGVTTVVLKLLNMLAPDVAVFGEKDWQQLAIIRRMATDLDLPVEIAGAPTVRDSDGLALSSRNIFLTATERQAAAALPRVLAEAAGELRRGGPAAPVLDEAVAKLAAAGFREVDYVALVDECSLEPVPAAAPGSRLLAAARIGSTRLIDNLSVGPAETR